jgi:RNA polymerase sigma-70 factor (ECF subfamily)
MKRVIAIGLVAAASSAYAPGPGQEITLQSAPPVVVKTEPQAGSDNVDPGLDRITVTFSKQMRDKSWSWVLVTRDSFPQTTGGPKYLADKRTCVLPVKLQPGKTYAIWINKGRYAGFKDGEGRSAVPYLLVFKTRPE